MTTRAAVALITSIRSSVFRHGDPRPISILVVDDDELVRGYVDRVLRHAGYHTAMATDANEAIRMAWTDGPFDLLLTDLVMPRMNGDELARRLRLSQPNLPVLYFTGFSDRLFIDRATLWHGEAFLDKPCSPKGLLDAVSQVAAAAV
jgi:two-component system, cell cycle sensor histidine kinase and response regulator CckA